jgi:hypothetical protein
MTNICWRWAANGDSTNSGRPFRAPRTKLLRPLLLAAMFLFFSVLHDSDAWAQGSGKPTSELDQTLNRVMDLTNGALRINAVATGGGGGPSTSFFNADQIFSKIFDSTNTAIKVNCVAGCPAATSGTVTSVGVALPSVLQVSGSPVTSSGTITATWASQKANVVLASPDGTAGDPVFRAVVDADLASSYSGVGSCPSNQWIKGLSRNGAPTCIQPGFSSISGIIGSNQLPGATALAFGGILLAGDLGNTASAPKVVRIQGFAVSSIAPNNGQVYQFNSGLNQWVPVTLPPTLPPTFQVNGTNTINQNTINFESSSNITVTNPSAGNVNIALSGTLPPGMLPTATAGSPGAIQLNGDLGGTSAAPKVTWLQGYALSSDPPSTGQCLVYGVSSWAPGSCGGSSGNGLPSSWTTNATNNAVTVQPKVGQDAVPLTLAPNVASPTADLLDICSTSPCSSGTKYLWVTANGNLNFLGNNATYGSVSQATQSYLRLYGSTTSANLAPPYFDLEKTDGSVKSYLAPSTTLNGVVAVTSAIPGGDIQAPAGAFAGTTSGGAGSGPVIVVANSAAGTTNGLLAKLTGAGTSPTATTAGTSDTAVPVYPVVTGGGISGNAALSVSGIAQCTFDSATTINHLVQVSATVPGDCHDAGGTAPTSGWVIGQVMSTNAVAGTYNIQVGPPGYNAASGGGTSATFQANGTGLSNQSTVNFTGGNNIIVSNPSGGNVNVAFSGTLPSNQAATAHSWINSYNTGSFTTAQPAFTDLSGSIAAAQTPLTTSQDLLFMDGSALGRLPISAVTSGQCLGNSAGTWASFPCSGGSGSGTVSSDNVAAGAFAFYPAAGGSTTVGPSSNLIDSSNILTYAGSGGISATSFAATGSGAGYFQAMQGTAPSLVANQIQFVAPASVASSGEALVYPGTPATGLELWTNSSGTLTGSFLSGATNTVLLGQGVGSAPSFGSVPNAALSNSSVTVNGTSVSLGASGNVGQLMDTNGNLAVATTTSSSAVDYVNVTNAAAGNPATVTISAAGTDSNINLNLVSKGTGTVQCNGSSCGSGGSGVASWNGRNGAVVPTSGDYTLDLIGGAAAALTWNNAGNSWTANWTSATTETFANTAAATSSTPQNSPAIALNGAYYTGSASGSDGWTIRDVVGSGANGTSTLTFAHTGSTTGIKGVDLGGRVNTTTLFASALTAGGGIAMGGNGMYSSSSGSSYTVQSGSDSSASQGSLTTRGGDVTGGSSALSAGNITVRGGNNASTSASATSGTLSLAGGNVTAAANVAGAIATLSGGLGTGNAVPADVVIKGGGYSNASGTTAQSSVTREIAAHVKTGLTSGSSSSLFQLTLGADQSSGGMAIVHVEAHDTTYHHSCSTTTEVAFAAEDTGGTVVANVSAIGTGASACNSTNTLTLSFALSNAAPAVFSVTPTVTGFTPTSMVATVRVIGLAQQDMTGL